MSRVHDACPHCGGTKQRYSRRCRDCAKRHRADPSVRIERHTASFWARVQKTGTCWLWTGVIDQHGYGRLSTATLGTGHAHRIAYILAHGGIPEGLDLDHLCRNPRCVNPDHLEPVTHRENLLRGDGVSARAARATHCPHGHPYDQANTYVKKDGSRSCRTCHRRRVARGKRSGRASV